MHIAEGILVKNASIMILRPLQSLLESGYPSNQVIQLLYYQSVFTTQQYMRVLKQVDQGEDIVNVIIETCLNKEVSRLYHFFKLFNTPSESIGITYDLLFKRHQTKQLFFSKLWYPLVLFVLAYLFVAASKFFLFEKLFDLVLSLGVSNANLIICSMILTVVFYLMNILIIVSISLVIVLLLFHKQFISCDQLNQLSKFWLIKKLITAYTTYYFLVYFNALIKYHVSTQHIFTMLKEQMPDKILSITVENCEACLVSGASITQAVDSQLFFDHYFKKVFSLGYHSGHLEKTLLEFQQHYQNALETKFVHIASTFQYLLFLLTGLIIVFIYYSMLMPLFDITTQI